MKKDILIIGGGAAGFFAAINCAEKNPSYNITILEKSPSLLSKVKVSGGGRCNVTHACFDPRELAAHYPRGEKQLLGPFTKFNPSDTVEWFEKRGVKLKRESDGRMFPVTDSSQTIINCFLNEAKRLRVTIKIQTGVEEFTPPVTGNTKWTLRTNKNEILSADAIVVTSGAAQQMWRSLEKTGHTIVAPVPSLFTFNIKDKRLTGLEGISVEQAMVSINGQKLLQSSGPLLITHWGLSGPAILRLSAWGARVLASANHQFDIAVNWTGADANEIKEHLRKYIQAHPKKNVSGNPLFNIPKRLWERLAGNVIVNYAALSNKQIDLLVGELTASHFHVSGKSTYKDEFVTAGGVDLNEVDFKTMQSKKLAGLYFAGEVLDIDAITGGFNFQAAWTTGWIAAQAI